MRILVVEDDKNTAVFVSKALRSEGFAVDVLHNGNEGLMALCVTPFDAVVLDIMLPGRDGLSVLKQLRTKGNSTPVLLLSARGEVNERVQGLNAGADDYLAKPFALEELVARIRVLLRRGSESKIATLHVGDHYPVVSGSFSGASAAQDQTQTLAPSVNFEDLGLVLKVTPTVHENMEVTLDLDAQFKTLGSGSFNGIPVIDSRQYQGKVRLTDGEWAVVAGLVSTTDSETPTGVAGLSSLPWIGGLFTRHTQEHGRSEILLVLKPHLVSLPPWEEVTPPLWVGTDTRPPTQF